MWIPRFYFRAYTTELILAIPVLLCLSVLSDPLCPQDTQVHELLKCNPDSYNAQTLPTDFCRKILVLPS